MLLGWDRPVDGRVASLQLLNMIEASEKASSSIGSIIPSKQPTTVPYSLSQSVFTPLSVSMTDAYHEIIPRVFSALASALQRDIWTCSSTHRICSEDIKNDLGNKQ